MHDFLDKPISIAQKEALKRWLKQQQYQPFDSPQRRQEIDHRVEEAAQKADYIESLAKSCNMSIEEFLCYLANLR